MKIDLVIPVQHATHQLEEAVNALEQFSNDVETELYVIERADLNVSEARQLVLDDDSYSNYICYLDDDSIMIDDHWLDKMVKVLEECPDAGAVFGGEWWGDEQRPKIVDIGGQELPTPGNGMTPAACMLVDKTRLGDHCFWDQDIGLRNGWLGGDFEEVDFCHRLQYDGLKLYQASGTQFHHTGGKSTLRAFQRTDRCVCTHVMQFLLNKKWIKWPEREGFFKDLHYVKADPHDDCMLAADESLRKAYKDVLRRNCLHEHPMIRRLSLV